MNYHLSKMVSHQWIIIRGTLIMEAFAINLLGKNFSETEKIIDVPRTSKTYTIPI